MDDQLASKAARVYELKPIPITYLLILSVRKKIIDAEEGLNILDGMIERGYRLSAEDYVSIKKRL
ncbi:MAG: hypothetical protein ACE5K4_12805 [Candidatus Hydrothermarchaeota archaeon]